MYLFILKTQNGLKRDNFDLKLKNKRQIKLYFVSLEAKNVLEEIFLFLHLKRTSY